MNNSPCLRRPCTRSCCLEKRLEIAHAGLNPVLSFWDDGRILPPFWQVHIAAVSALMPSKTFMHQYCMFVIHGMCMCMQFSSYAEAPCPGLQIQGDRAPGGHATFNY